MSSVFSLRVCVTDSEKMLDFPAKCKGAFKRKLIEK
jgi:hypothetical protein